MKKNLKINEMLEYYDVPQLFTAQTSDGEDFLCLGFDIDESGNMIYISAQLSKYQLNSFLNGDMELTYILRFAATKEKLYLVTMYDEENITAKQFQGKLTSKMLPEKPYYFNPNPLLLSV